jgi:probable rRNA maturation factor
MDGKSSASIGPGPEGGIHVDVQVQTPSAGKTPAPSATMSLAASLKRAAELTLARIPPVPQHCEAAASELRASADGGCDEPSGTGVEATVVVTDDRTIQRLNHEYLGKDRPTDVLAFGAQDQALEGGGFVAAPESARYLGDVIVSYDRAAAQAREAGHSVEQELCLLTIHGLLHLLGYDHADEDAQAAMWAKQDAILEELGWRASEEESLLVTTEPRSG